MLSGGIVHFKEGEGFAIISAWAVSYSRRVSPRTSNSTFLAASSVFVHRYVGMGVQTFAQRMVCSETAGSSDSRTDHWAVR